MPYPWRKWRTGDYALLLSKMNSRTTFSPQVHKHLDTLLEGPMQSPGNQESFQHLGFKGGSTSYMLNTAMYVLDKENNCTEIVLFLNNIAKQDYPNIQENLNAFLKGVLANSEVRRKVHEQIGRAH